MSLVVSPIFANTRPTGIDPVQLSYLNWLENQEFERGAKYAKFRNYYEGEQATALTTRLRKFLHVSTKQEFSLNLCPIVVDSVCEKMKVAKLQAGTQTEQLQKWWDGSRMDAGQGVVHLAARRDGDTYVLVEFDDLTGMPVITQENAYDGSTGMHVIYSDEHRRMPLVAIKRWTITTGVGIATLRTNLYYPDRVEKYASIGAGANQWQPFYEEGQPWPIPWTVDRTESGEPIGIPVIHFRNKDQGYSYGESELEDTCPMQDGLNKSVIDILGAADMTGFRIFTMTGEKPKNMTLAPGSWAYTENPNARIGAIDAASVDGCIAVKDSFAVDIGRLTRTPLSSFQITGAIAAAGTLKEQRDGLDAKIADREIVDGNAWEDVMTLARRVNNVFGSKQLPETQTITCEWKAIEEPDPKELAVEVELLYRGQSASVEQRVRKLHPDWDDEKITAEVDAIQNEFAVPVPEPGNPFGMAGGSGVLPPVPTDVITPVGPAVVPPPKGP